MDPKHWTARWIGPEQIGAGLKNYAFQADLKLQARASGVFFRVQPNEDAYLWQINTFGPAPVLKEHVRENGGYRVLKQVSLAGVVTNAAMAHWHTLKIIVQGDRIESNLKGRLVGVL